MTASTSKAPSVQLVVPAHVPPYGWVTLYKEGGGEHIVPSGDIYPHYAFNCACQPLQIDQTLQHNAFDERDKFENKTRKPS